MRHCTLRTRALHGQESKTWEIGPMIDGYTHARRTQMHAELQWCLFVCYAAASCAFFCCIFNFFSVLINSRMPTGISSNKPLVSFPPSMPQLDSHPPPSSSILVATRLGAPLPATICPDPVPSCRCACIAALACALFSAHSSMSSLYNSHTQFTHPDIQQLSGSVGFGGTLTPAMICEAAFISFRRSAGPASFEPKTIRAFSRVSSFCVFGRDSGGGGSGAVSVRRWALDVGFLSISSWVSVEMVAWRWGRRTCVETSNGSSLFASWCYIAFVSTLYPFAVLRP
jgi:hypothetical protein